MKDNELQELLEVSLEMIRNIKQQSPFNSEEVTNKALLNVSKFLNNIVLNNNGKQLLLFNED